MSHFLCLVLVEPDQEVEDAVERLPAPYDENIEVPPYEHVCYCVEDDAPDPECYDCHGEGVVDSTYNPKSKWDWYQIGGRWSGLFAQDYDPEKDPRNQEVCDLCGGTGHRRDLIWYRAEHGGVTAAPPTPDAEPVPWCNGCAGKGQRVMWPTQWIPAPGNTSRVGDLPEGTVPYAVVTPNGEWYEKGLSRNENPDWDLVAAKIFNYYPDRIAVAVDCHI